MKRPIRILSGSESGVSYSVRKWLRFPQGVKMIFAGIPQRRSSVFRCKANELCKCKEVEDEN